jgi:hypothetical protein
MGQRWRKIAVLTTTPYRSDDAPRHACAHHDVLAPHRCSCPGCIPLRRPCIGPRHPLLTVNPLILSYLDY